VSSSVLLQDGDGDELRDALFYAGMLLLITAILIAYRAWVMP